MVRRPDAGSVSQGPRSGPALLGRAVRPLPTRRRPRGPPRAAGGTGVLQAVGPCARRRRRPPRQIPCDTDGSLLAALCPECRRALVQDAGETVRRHLRRALEPVPLDLDWFSSCCDECYRVFWKAVSLARHGLLHDAWHWRLTRTSTIPRPRRPWVGSSPPWPRSTASAGRHRKTGWSAVTSPWATRRCSGSRSSCWRPAFGGGTSSAPWRASRRRGQSFCAVDLFQQAVPFFDERRDCRPVHADIPINLAKSLTLHGDLEQAQAEFGKCRYDRNAYPCIAAAETFTGGCIALCLGKSREALNLFSEAQLRFERLGQPRDCALAATYSVEAHCALGDRDVAAVTIARSQEFFTTWLRKSLPEVGVSCFGSCFLLGSWAAGRLGLPEWNGGREAGLHRPRDCLPCSTQEGRECPRARLQTRT